MNKFRANPDTYLHKAENATPVAQAAPTCCGHDHAAPAASATDKPNTDPVCGMKTATNPAKAIEHAGTTYYFCSTRCMDKFRTDPQQYLNPQAPAKAVSKDALFTCPMHPEVQQIGPGTCPKCGMALEPMDATAEEDTSELRDMTRRFSSP